MKTECLVYKEIPVSELEPFAVRDIREQIVEILSDRIKNNFNPSRPLSVIERNGKYLVADGNHRLEAAKRSKLDMIPCIVYPEETDPYKLAVESNIDEDVYAPFDLFDWLDILEKLKEEGFAQEEIGAKLGWSRGQVGKYFMLLNSIVPEVLDLARSVQRGTGTENVPVGTKGEKKNKKIEFDFTEGWFRYNEIYSLQPEYQKKFMKWFIEEQECEASGKQIKEKVNSLKEIQEQVAYVELNLNPELDKTDLIEAVKRGEYSTGRLKKVVDRLNEKAKNKALFGVDALEELKKLPSGFVDLVITDPPYGVDFIPSRKTDAPDFEDSKEESLKLLDEVCAELKRVCKANAHIYVFSGCVNAFEFKSILQKYFRVYDNWITWVKENHTPCDFKKRYASKYEIIWFAKCENDERELNEDCSCDVIFAPTPKQKYHNCQKPIELLEYLIKNSSSFGEIVLDPFAGSGSTLIAAAKNKRYYIGFELEKKYESNFRKIIGDVEDFVE